MLRAVLFAAALLVFAAPCYAGGYCYDDGAYVHCYDYSSGQSQTCIRAGNITYCN